MCSYRKIKYPYDHMCSYVVFLFGMLFCAVLTAAELSLQDFAYGVDINPVDKTALQSIVLPDSYYRYSVRRDGGDLRVYNSSGQLVPHKVESGAVQEQHQQQHDLVFFPIYGESNRDLDGLSLQIERGIDGTLINIESPSTQPAPTQQIIAYIIDASAANQVAQRAQLTRLVFDWSDPEYGFINGLRLSVSDDLEQWISLVNDQSLSRLDYAGQSLGKTHIDVPVAIKSNYLRLSWPQGQPALDLESIMGGYQWSELNSRIERQSLQLPITPTAEAESDVEINAYQFNSGGQFPLEQIEFFTNETVDNEYYAGELYSRVDSSRRWVKHSNFEQFRLHTSSGEVSSEPHRLQGIRDRQWLVKFAYPQQISIGTAPQVQLGWRPERLLFIAQGNAPFTMAFGNPMAMKVKVTGLLNSLPLDADIPDSARLGAVRELGGVNNVASVDSLPWREVLLWLVLIAGVLVMLWMAAKLYRQMNQPD